MVAIVYNSSSMAHKVMLILVEGLPRSTRGNIIKGGIKVFLGIPRDYPMKYCRMAPRDMLPVYPGLLSFHWYPLDLRPHHGKYEYSEPEAEVKA